MSLRTPLGRALGMGSAKDGTEHFITQQVSSVALLFLGCWFMYSIYTMESLAYLEVVRFISEPLNMLLLTLSVLTAAYHSNLGVQVVMEDYIVHHGIKVMSLLACRFVHAIIAAGSVLAILRIGLAS
jgi:succinate dehydrogenase / fumarate reductase membrane anchor subunit